MPTEPTSCVAVTMGCLDEQPNIIFGGDQFKVRTYYRLLLVISVTASRAWKHTLPVNMNNHEINRI